MITKETLLSKIFDWEDMLPGGYVTGTLVQSGEEDIIKGVLSKTVTKFIADFRGLVLELCGFDHERADRPRYFYTCPFFGRNVACGHPRVIRTKFQIAYTLLYRKGAIDESGMDEYRDKVYAYTEPHTGDDFRATSGYREEHANGGIKPDSPTLQKMRTNQSRFGTPLLALRDEIAEKLEKVFKLN